MAKEPKRPKLNREEIFVDTNSASYKELERRNRQLQTDILMGRNKASTSHGSMRNPDGTLKSANEVFATEIAAKNNSWEMQEPREVESAYSTLPAPTTNPSRPRATKMAYNKEQEKLVIRFRGSKKVGYDNGPWIAYNDVPVEMWNDLKSSDSTGKYLAGSGLDNYPWESFDPNEMNEETRVMFNS